MDEWIFFKVVLAHSDYSGGFVVFIVKAEYAKQALVYVETFKKGRVISVEPTDYWDFISVPRDYLDPKCKITDLVSPPTSGKGIKE